MLTLKLAFRTICKNPLHAVITFVCVTLSSTLLASVCSLCKTLLAQEQPGTSNYAITYAMCVLMIVIVAIAAAVIISSVFSVSFGDRVNTLGLLSTVGMTGKGKAVLILYETALYGVFGSALGVALGRFVSEWYITMLNEQLQIYYRQLYGHFYGNEVAERILAFEPSGKLLLLAFAISLATTLASAVRPMIRASRLSVIDSLKAEARINVSLREGLFEKLINERFGRVGRLAAQNFDNNGPRYRLVSMALSASTVVFIAVYSMFMWSMWEKDIYNPFEDPRIVPVLVICFVLTAIALIGAASSAVTNIKSRKREFAILKSLGLDNGDMLKMMLFESVLIFAHAVTYGLLGSLLSVWIEFLIQKMNGERIFFYFPAGVWLIFVVINALFCVFFAVYAVRTVKRVNIAQTIK